MSESMASSTELGSRSRRSGMGSYSKSVSPSWRWRLDGDAVVNARSHRLEDPQAVGRSGERIDGVLGMGHQPEPVPGLVAPPGDVVLGTVRILPRRVAEDHAYRRRTEVPPGRVLDRY